MSSAPAQRIAVLFGIPVSRGEFLDRAADAQWDYGRKLLSRWSAEEAFDRIYAPVCDAAERLLRRASAGGVSVYPRARLRDLEEASRAHDVLVIVAHWRGSGVEDPDLLDGWPAALTGSVADGPLRVVIDLLRRRSDFAGISAASAAHPAARAAVVDALNDAITGRHLGRFLPQQIGTVIDTDDLIIETLSRDLLDDAFDGTLRRGNQLELADALHPVADVNNAVSSGFSGCIDLSCCTSSILGTYLKLIRGDALRVIMGDQYIVPAPQLKLIETALELLELDPAMRYADARIRISRGLASRFHEIQEGTDDDRQKPAP